MKHYIIVKYNNLAKDNDKLFHEISGLFDKAKGINGIFNVETYQSVMYMANRYNLMIVMEMDKEALEVFDSSDIHREWKEKYSKIIENKAIFDCD